MTQTKRISRRAALARLGLGATSIYMSPVMLGLSKAHAASSVSAATSPSPASPPSAASAPSGATPPSPPSAVSNPSGPSQPGDQADTSSTSSGPSGPGSCRQTALPNGGQITRRDYERAQQAISRGDAQPLREVLNSVQSRYPGRLLRVGFSESGRLPAFRVVIVNPSGAIISITVDAGSGQITNVQAC